jgi:hypothetical protein
LCAEEFRYVHTKNKTGFIHGFCCYLIYRLLWLVERAVFNGSIVTEYTVEAVSPALKDYMVKNFGTDSAKIFIAQHDIPKPVSAHQIEQWRMQIRKCLNIRHDAYIYCYSGSFKPWQCAEETVEFFVEQYHKDNKNHLLILSQDKDVFTKVLESHAIPKSNYRVINVSSRYLLEYLSAADAGLLFREPDVINWVSRPTKMLEYQAVGLKVIHNNTVAWLVK